MGRLFGTDGVRGIFGRDLTIELAYGLGHAAVIVLRRHEPQRITTVVGRDTRASGEPLEQALVEGMRAAGADAILVGVQPTPAVAFLTTDLEATAGAVISASHNPAKDNGIKFFGPSGYKLPDDVEDEIEAVYRDGDEGASAEPGRAVPLPGAAERYLEHVAGAAEAPLTGMKVVVDCANGASFRDAPRSFGAWGPRCCPSSTSPTGRTSMRAAGRSIPRS